MHGGIPPADVFPITSMQLAFKDPTPSASTLTATVEDPATVTRLQQYPLGEFQPLKQWFRELIAKMQQPQAPAWDCVIANGAAHSIETILRCFLDPGDPILVEEFLFPQVLEGIILPIGLQPVGLTMDEQGTHPWPRR